MLSDLLLLKNSIYGMIIIMAMIKRPTKPCVSFAKGILEKPEVYFLGEN